MNDEISRKNLHRAQIEYNRRMARHLDKPKTYTHDDTAREAYAETTRRLIDRGIPTASIRKAIRQQHDVLGDPENHEPYGAQNHPLK